MFQNIILHRSVLQRNLTLSSLQRCAARSSGLGVLRQCYYQCEYRGIRKVSHVSRRSPDDSKNKNNDNNKTKFLPQLSVLVLLSCCFWGLDQWSPRPSTKTKNEAPPLSAAASGLTGQSQSDASIVWRGVFYPALDLAQATAKLRAEETSTKFAARRDGTGVTRLDATRVPSNNPTEDQKSHVVANVGAAEDWTFWGVYDGHAGWATAKVVQNHLSTYVAQSLRRARAAATTTFSPESVDLAIKQAFVKLDDEIINDGLNALSDASTHAEALSRIAPARAGSCALLAILDPASATLRVACTGDSRAVLGRRTTSDSSLSAISNASSSSSSSSGADSQQYTAEPLSTDQTGFNPDEVSRFNVRHADEADAIDPTTGRLLGLAVTRAFGDHRWKWPLDAVQRCKTDFYGPSPRPKYVSPPYMTAEPEVTTTRVCSGDFLILATDGLWDHISSADAVECVSMWIKGERQKMSTSPLSSLTGIQTSPSQSSGPPSPLSLLNTHTDTSSKSQRAVPATSDHKEDGKARGYGQGYDYDYRGTPPDFVVEDANAATHLVRNALGGRRRDLFCSVMTAQAPESRAVRDDITVQIVFFGDYLSLGGGK